MTFIWPFMLVSLLLVPLGGLLYARQQQRRGQLVARFGGLGLLPQGGGRGLGRRRHLPPVLFLSGVGILLFSLARPQMVVSLPRQEGLVILAFDVSRSMAAADLDPTRMEAAKEAAWQFVERQPATVEIGVVAFSDNGFSVQAPTGDQEEIRAAIDRLVPQRGTALGQGILTSLNAIAAANAVGGPNLYSNLTPGPTAEPTPVTPGTFTSAVIVLLSDGDNNEAPDPLVVALEAAKRGVRIFTVGIGSPEGATLNIDGFNVHSRLDEAALQQIAHVTNGQYYSARDPEELQAIYADINPQFVIRPEEMEVTSILAGAGIGVLLLGAAFSLLWFSRVP